MDLVLYHDKCPDGWCAAYVAKKRYPEAVLVGLDHGLDGTATEEILQNCRNKDVLMVDYSLPTRALNDELHDLTKSFQIYDHHKTAQATLEGAPYAVFDMTRSGAGLTWDYLFGKDSNYVTIYKEHSLGEWTDIERHLPRPWWVSYVEDKDLWTWKLLRSREVNAYIGTVSRTLTAWYELTEMSLTKVAEQGSLLLKQIDTYVNEVSAIAQSGMLAGYTIAVLNVSYRNCSEVGNNLAKTHDISLTWYEDGEQMKFSLRSIGDKDVSAVAKRFGGGGHRNAAGFQLGLYEGRKLIDAILNRSVAAESRGDRQPGGCI